MGRRDLLVMIGVLAVVGLAATLYFARPAFLSSLFGSDKPAAVAGDEVPPIEDTPLVRIATAGDTGTGDAAQRATADRIVQETRGEPYDALLLLGDLIYEDGDAAEVDSKVLEPFKEVTGAGTQLLPVLGNHDYVSGEQQEILTALGRRRPWYAERIGPVRVVVLDSNRVDDPGQTAWLRETLSQDQPPQTWTVVAMHHPPYSAGDHGSTLDVQQAWSPLFAEYDVPLVLAGHDHDYQRSVPLDGVTYVVSGAGAKLRATGTKDFTEVSASTRHFVDLLFYDDRLVGRAIDQSGRLVDAFTISR
jgi:3',5'-cyclic AMP phosphodiesterase CpdA